MENLRTLQIVKNCKNDPTLNTNAAFFSPNPLPYPVPTSAYAKHGTVIQDLALSKDLVYR